MNQMHNDFPQTVASDEQAANYLPAVGCLRPNSFERVNDRLIINDVKMIVWDLDETFWKGTLAEGGITFVDSHAQMVQTLAGRGIISSISSKNDHRAAQDLLEQNGIWGYFVFPSISWSPKGKTVAEIIENAALRAENVLFIDDNISNLEEVRFFNPGIMLAQPSEILSGLLDHPHLAGKADPHLKRLRQYQLLQTKFLARQAHDLSNEEFLRSSGIRLCLDFDVDRTFDRVVDLVNRTNQLNYTKKRLVSENDIADFRASLNQYGVSAGCVSCSDRYGDYGVIGFYMLKRVKRKSELIHFVFSCRTMNMGVEQFVYEFLGKPDITVVPQVASDLDSQQGIDWITLAVMPDQPSTLVDLDRKLLLVGGCDLLQLSSFCSSNRTEFVNKITTNEVGELVVRYDDPVFFTADRETLRQSIAVRQLVGWTHDDALLLDREIAQAEIIILAMRGALREHYFETIDGIKIRMIGVNIKRFIQNREDWFKRNTTPLNIDTQGRLTLIKESFEAVRRISSANANIFVVGSNTRGFCAEVPADSHTQKWPVDEETQTSIVYNKFCRDFCQDSGPRFHFIDVNDVVPLSSLLDDQHFGRVGYHALSVHIMRVIATNSLQGTTDPHFPTLTRHGSNDGRIVRIANEDRTPVDTT